MVRDIVSLVFELEQVIDEALSVDDGTVEAVSDFNDLYLELYLLEKQRGNI